MVTFMTVSFKPPALSGNLLFEGVILVKAVHAMTG